MSRKYALSKVEQGDYLLPSNDGRMIFRMAKCESGEWDLWRWASPVSIGSYVDTGDWSRWELVACFNSRADAVDEALRLSA